MRLKAPLKVLWVPDTNVDDMLSSFAAEKFCVLSRETCNVPQAPTRATCNQGGR